MSAEASGAPRGSEIVLSVVVPVYGCAECLVALHGRLTDSVRQITDRYEFVFVDDRSLDGGWTVLERLAGEDPHVRAFRLSRNFGQDAAITAGLAQAAGDWAVVMDCDLQEAPEDIPRMWAAAGEGYDIVRTVRRGWRHSAFRRWTSRVYRRLTLETDVRPDYSNLSLLSRRVVDAFLGLKDRDREYMIALDWLGFDSTQIEIEHHERHSGESGYTLNRLIRVALDGMFFRSTVLLRLVVLVGFLIASAGLALAAFEVIDYFVEPEKSVPGYTSLAVLVLVMAGFIIVSVGVVGLYVGRIFEQVKNRPLFLIDQQVGGVPAEPVPAYPGGVVADPVAADPVAAGSVPAGSVAAGPVSAQRPPARTPARVRPESQTTSEPARDADPSAARVSPR
jgi:polyisoprenyl-phosphate glycosyltransferase